MKNILSCILMLLTLVANAQDYSKMSPFVMQMVKKHLVEKSSANSLNTDGKQATEPIVLTLVQGEESALQGHCLRHQGDIHIVASTLEQLSDMSYSDHISRIEANECNSDITLDDASQHVNVESLWQGSTNLPQAFRGAGTVIGIADIGFDLTHPAFRDDEGKLRISRFWDFLNIPEGKEYSETDPYPIGTFFDNSEAILQQARSTDAEIAYHGTHTLGIATGNSSGTPLQGMAPEADIYAVNDIVSSNKSLLPERLKDYVNDTFTLLAFQYIYDYADEQKKPCVVSYSIGGPQSMNDGDLLYKEYLARMTEKPGHIFVASVGNDGAKSGYLPKSSNQTTVGGAIQTNKTVVYLGVSTPKDLTLRITDYTDEPITPHDVVLDMPATATEKGTTSPSGLIYGEHNHKEFGNLTLSVFPYQDPFREGRISYDIVVRESSLDTNSERYVVELTGENTEADIFLQNGSLVKTSYDSSLTGAQPNSGNLLRPGSLEEAIGVGASAWRTSYVNTKGSTVNNNHGTNGVRADFSSCGPAVSGLTKPDTLAPGVNICSATNSYYSINPLKVTQEITYEDKTYEWHSLDGTSMATPMVAGIIALWLEADPTLTRERILDVFAHTATHYDEALSYPNNHYGYGEIDAYKGLLYILNILGVEGLSSQHLSNATVRPNNDGTISIKLDGEPQHSIRCKAFTTDGKLVHTTLLPSHSTEHRLSLPGIHGIVAIQLDGMGSTLVRIP
ncbi:MAG: S8 family serine peptidase [Prevotella sp.]|nr:S8 family serine peptidase [Prevotella sp.]